MSGVNCPWASMKQATLPFCEARLCAWVAEPANAWSNLVVVLLGIAIVKSELSKSRTSFPLIGGCTILLGLGSFFLHASATFLGQIVDLAGMFLIVAAFFARQIEMRWVTPKWTGVGVVACGTVIPTSLSLFGDFVGIPLFALVLGGLLWFSFSNVNSKVALVDAKYLWRGIGIFTIGFLSWIFDVTGLVCDPHNHWFNGHALWHVLSGIAIWNFYRAINRSNDRSIV